MTKKKRHFIFMFYSPFDKNNLMQALNKKLAFYCSVCAVFFALKSKWIGSDIFVFLLNNSDHGQVPLLACGAILEMME